MKNFIRIFLISISIIAQLHLAFAQTASILPQAETQFLNNNGDPVTSGTVDFYIPGSTTRKTTWQDADRTVANANPVKLNGSGRAVIYGYGGYRQVLKDRNGNLIWDRVTNSYSIPNGQITTGDGDAVGTVKAWSGLVAPNQYVFAYGQEISRTTYPDFLTAVTLTQNVNCTSGNNVLSGISDTSQTPIGASIEVSCVTGTVTVSSKTSNSYTISANAISTATVSAVVFPFGNGNGTTTFNVPDFRGRVIAGRDNMGGIAASRLTSTYFANASSIGATGGTQSSTLAQANLPALNLPVSGMNITANQIPITTVGGTLTLGLGFVAAGQAGSTSGILNLPAPGILINNQGNAATGGSATPFSLVQPSITLNYIIKITPDITGLAAAGVQSIQTMAGNITCGSTFNCSSQSLGLANQADKTILSNISGGSSVPSANTLTAILDNILGTTQGSLIYRNASIWTTLAPGTSGFVLATQGAGQNPAWIANSNPSLNQTANTFYAGPATGVPATPTFRAIVAADLPPTVTSVALTAPGIFSVAGSPVTTTGTLALSLATQTANTVFAGPASGGALAPTFRALVYADIKNPIRVVTAAGGITVTSADYYVVANKTSGAATAVTLPSSPASGDTYVIKDGKGDAATNNITVTPAAGNIDGAANYVMNVNYQSITVVYNGTQWNIV